jgi:copper transport protein
MRRALVLAACVATALTVPAAAWAHAALLRTVPAASKVVNTPPRSVALVYSEAVEPRFAVVSVTDEAGRQQTAGSPHRSPANADELDVPLRHLRQGWYLVFWRAISVDGHPVRGAFTFAVGPNQGPAPQFVIPSLSETAATPSLVAARWASFLGFMVAIGLFMLRTVVIRPLGGSPRALSVAFWLALGLALVAVPVYVLLAPGAAGHAAQTSPRVLALALDWLHLAAGSVWLGGLIGLLVLIGSLPAAQRVAGLAVCVPRFSNVAFVSVVALLGSGVWASVLHLPTLGSLWQTSYGQAIIVKAGLLLGAMLIASVNLLRTRPALAAADPPPRLAVLLRRLVGAEVLLVVAAVAVAAVLSSLAPPSKALAAIGSASGKVGPGAVSKVVEESGYQLELRVTPNRAAVPNDFEVRITRNSVPVRGAQVTATFAMLDMEMPQQSYALAESSPGVYRRTSPALVMVGHWGLSFEIAPKGAAPFTVQLVDRASG